MRRLFFIGGLLVAFVRVLPGQAVTSPSDSVGPRTIMTATLREAFDTTVSPCDDFDQYVNGGWRAVHPGSRLDVFQDVRYRTDQRLLAMLDSARRMASSTTDPLTRVLGTFYASCLVADSVKTESALTPGGAVPTTRDMKCLASTDRVLGTALGVAFHRALIAPDDSVRTQALVGSIHRAIAAQVRGLSWVNDSVKDTLLRTLERMDRYINTAPDIPDYSTLTLSFTRYADNLAMIERFGQNPRNPVLPRDSVLRKYGGSKPHYFAAVAHAGERWIIVTSMVFQPPFFDFSSETAVGYAALGMVIGHETWHVLTPLLKWMERGDGRARVTPLATQYLKFGDSGWGTVNEDLADLGGLLAAFTAWREHGAATAVPLLEGFTPEQRFFLYYARLWRAPKNVKTDQKHSINRARVNGVVMQMPAFAQAFGCREGDRMALPADRRAPIF